MSKSTEIYTEASDKIRSRDLFYALLFSQVAAVILSILFLITIFILSVLITPIITTAWSLNLLLLETVAVFTFIPYLVLGQILARKGLETGIFGYWTCVGTGILIAAITVCVGAIAFFGFATISATSFLPLLATGSTFGALGATLFWIFITRRNPELVAHRVGKGAKAVVLLAACAVIYGAGVIGDPILYTEEADRNDFRKEYPAAVANYNQAIEIIENNVNLIGVADLALTLSYRNRGSAYIRLGEYDKAISDLDHAWELGDRSYIFFVDRGDAYIEIGNLDQAIVDYTEAIAIDPDQISAYANRAIAYRKKGDMASADADSTKANDNSYFTWIDIGNAQVRIGNLDQAIASYTEAIEINPDYAAAYANRAIAYRKKGDTASADADCTKAKAIDQGSQC